MLQELMDDEDEMRDMNLSSRPGREEKRRVRERDRLEREMERSDSQSVIAVGISKICMQPCTAAVGTSHTPCFWHCITLVQCIARSQTADGQHSASCMARTALGLCVWLTVLMHSWMQIGC